MFWYQVEGKFARNKVKQGPECRVNTNDYEENIFKVRASVWRSQYRRQAILLEKKVTKAIVMGYAATWYIWSSGIQYGWIT